MCVNLMNTRWRKPDLKPYTSASDERLCVCCIFMTLLSLRLILPIVNVVAWNRLSWLPQRVGSNDVPDAQKPMMLLSRETIEGLHITSNNSLWKVMAFYTYYSIYLVKSFVELTLLTQSTLNCWPLPPQWTFLTRPLKDYFGQQRARGGYSYNPTMQACIASAQGSMVMVLVQGNSSRNASLTTHPYWNDHDISSYILVCIVSLHKKWFWRSILNLLFFTFFLLANFVLL